MRFVEYDLPTGRTRCRTAFVLKHNCRATVVPCGKSNVCHGADEHVPFDTFVSLTVRGGVQSRENAVGLGFEQDRLVFCGRLDHIGSNSGVDDWFSWASFGFALGLQRHKRVFRCASSSRSRSEVFSGIVLRLQSFNICYDASPLLLHSFEVFLTAVDCENCKIILDIIGWQLLCAGKVVLR